MKKISISYLSIFWSVVVIATVGFLMTVILSIFSVKDYESCYSYICINFLFKEVLLIPVAILAATIPICGLLLALHKSDQTQQQIEITRNHNTANNYFMHKREFASLCAELESKHTVKIDPKKAYLKLFPINSYEQVFFEYNFKPETHISDYFQWPEHMNELGSKISATDYQCNFEDAHLFIRYTNITAWDLGLEYVESSPTMEVELSENGVKASYQLVAENLSDCWLVFFKISEEFAIFTKSIPYHTGMKWSARKIDDFLIGNKKFRIVNSQENG